MTDPVRIAVIGSDTPPEGLASALRARLASDTLSLMSMLLVLAQGRGDPWLSLRTTVLDHLVAHPHHGTSLLNLCCQIYGWQPPRVRNQRKGPDHAPRFTAQVHVALEPNAAPVQSPWIRGRSVKEARSRACVAVLAQANAVPQAVLQLLQ